MSNFLRSIQESPYGRRAAAVAGIAAAGLTLSGCIGGSSTPEFSEEHTTYTAEYGDTFTGEKGLIADFCPEITDYYDQIDAAGDLREYNIAQGNPMPSLELTANESEILVPLDFCDKASR